MSRIGQQKFNCSFLWQTSVAALAIFSLQQVSCAANTSADTAFYEQCDRLLQSKHYDQCTEIIMNKISVKPSKELWQCLGTAYYRKGDLRRAENSFKVGLTMDQNCWYLWGGLARVLYDCGRFEESQQALSKANLLKAKTSGSEAGAQSASQAHPALLTMEAKYDCSCPTISSTPVSDSAPAVSTLPIISDGTALPPCSPDPAPVCPQESSSTKAASTGPVSAKSRPALAPGFLPSLSAPSWSGSDISSNPTVRETLNTMQAPSGLPATQLPVAHSTESGPFPGKGDRRDWVKACRVYDEGIDLMHTGQFQKAAKQFREAISIYPYDPDFFHNLGFALKRMHSFAEAEKAYSEALNLRHDDWDTWCNLGSVLFDQRRYAEAREAFTSAASYAPDSYGREHIEWFLAEITRRTHTLQS